MFFILIAKLLGTLRQKIKLKSKINTFAESILKPSEVKQTKKLLTKAQYVKN